MDRRILARLTDALSYARTAGTTPLLWRAAGAAAALMCKAAYYARRLP